MAIEPEDLESLPPQGHVRIIYLGPVSPHWEVRGLAGERSLIDAFRQRVTARLQLLHTARPAVPAQPRAGGARRRAGTAGLEWDLGYEEPEPTA